MDDWTLGDTVGILIVLGMSLAAASTVEGIAQVLVVLVGVVLAVLWIGRFLLEGYNETIEPGGSDD